MEPSVTGLRRITRDIAVYAATGKALVWKDPPKPSRCGRYPLTAMYRWERRDIGILAWLCEVSSRGTMIQSETLERYRALLQLFTANLGTTIIATFIRIPTTRIFE